ncbi:MAG: GTP-binding protein, partial [Clostridia bacterium]|nr:GTP-binding protein [Clostridia bacterium]
MKVYDTEKIRNIAIISHGGAGKTTLTEAMLHNAGVTKRVGKVEDGNTVTDYDAEEIGRQISINTSLAPHDWEGCKINILDTPGFADFIADVKSALRVVDGVSMVVSAPDGVEVLTEEYWKLAEKHDLPRTIFINKMDRENADFEGTYEQLKESFGGGVVALQIPMGSEDDFHGVIDILKGKAFAASDGKGLQEQEVPSEFADKIDEYKEDLIEAVAENDDEVLMKYLEGEELTDEEINSCLKEGIINGTVFPVLCGSAVKNIGVDLLQGFIAEYMPNPRDVSEEKDLDDKPFAGLVFKTLSDPYTGKVSFIRVFQGKLTADKPLYNPNQEIEEKIGQLLIMRGKNQEQVDEVL